MNDIIFYKTVERIIQNYTFDFYLLLINLISLDIIIAILLYNAIRNGNLSEFGIFKVFKRWKK